MRIAFVTSGLEHLGIEALAAYVRVHGHEPVVIYEARPFSSGSGTDSAFLAKLLEPTPEETAARVLATKPDLVAFTSYSVTHRWAVDVARAIKVSRKVPIVFGGQHVGSVPERAIQEWSIDAVVEGEGEEPLIDLVNCAETNGFGRTDIANVTVKGAKGPIRNRPRPLIQDLDSLPWAEKDGFYSQVPALEREFYVMARRGCPYRCSFCEYSQFPEQYPEEKKSVRRRSVPNLIAELRHWKARGRVKKVFFWDAIFTLDTKWMAEFSEAYKREIGIPFECYTHPSTMTRDMARYLGEAGCIMVRVGVQSVNSDTLASVDRRGDRDRVKLTLDYLTEFNVPYSVDHIIGLPGEGANDQVEALRFYNKVRPRRIVAHWMTYFPGTSAFEQARKDGTLSKSDVERILNGEIGPGYMFDGNRGNKTYEDQDALQELSGVFDLLPLLPEGAIDWILDHKAYRHLRAQGLLRQLGAAALAIKGEQATREHVRHIFSTTLSAVQASLFRPRPQPLKD
jgi:radical SAM superfamily enzyme YgiQ (UPF0313 family)